MAHMSHPRLVKALSEKMSLLAATQAEEQWTFKVRGQSNNVYEQILTKETFTCSCPDQQGKKTFCKHLLFLVVRVAKQFELGAELAQRPVTTWKKSAFAACNVSWAKCLAHMFAPPSSASSTPSLGTTLEPENPCCICYEDFTSTDTLVNCKQTCKKHFHKICMERWLEHGDTCPMCRTEWKTEDDDEDEVENTLISSDGVHLIEGHLLEPSTASAAASMDTETRAAPLAERHTDIVISFDTTGSMSPCLAEVRRHVSSMTERLFREIPSLRIAIISHGDYCDGDKCITQMDFTENQAAIKKFVEDAPFTNGGDYPECYELVLRNCKDLSWRPEATMKSLILIGDAPPHGKNENPQKIDWRVEAESLKNRNIQVFSVQCLNRGNRESFDFYSEVAESTNGYHVFLDQFSYIKDMIQAICFKQYNEDHLEQFEKEMQDGSGGMSNAMRLMFDTMLGKKSRAEARAEMHPDRYRERYHGGSTPSSSSSASVGSKRSYAATSAAPSLDREGELRPSPPSRFQVFAVDSDINIREFCNNMGITFRNGRGFYEFTKPEIISDSKEIILMERTSGELYEGAAARAIAGIGSSGGRVKPGDLPKYRMFIQSTSPARKLIRGQGFLYEVA